MWRCVSRAVASVVLVVACSCSGERTGLNPEDKAPDIKGVDVAGTPQSLRQITGKAILVNFWATWCAPCMAELPALQSMYAALHEKGFTVVGIAVDDSPENIKQAQETYGLTYPIIIDGDNQSKRLYEIKGLPESFVLDAEQRVRIVVDPQPSKGPVTRIVGPREWSEKWASQVLTSLGTK